MQNRESKKRESKKEVSLLHSAAISSFFKLPENKDKIDMLKSPDRVLGREKIMPYLYLFLIDACSVHWRGSYPDYDKREPGYGQALMNAYSYAFENPIDHKLTPAFIKAVHQKALIHFKSKKDDLSQYNVSARNFGVIPPIAARQSATITEEGLGQFISTWLVDVAKPVHMIHFKSNNPAYPDYWLLPFNAAGEPIVIFRAVRDDKVLKELPYDEVKHTPIFREIINRILMRDGQHSIFINLISSDQLPLAGHSLPLNKILENMEKLLCDQYNQEISSASTSDERVLTIIKYAQRIVQLHARADGNGRLAYLMLNRLLHEEGEPLCLISDPNKLDCFSVEELLPLIREGQARYLNLVCGKEILYQDKYTKVHQDVLPPFVLPCVEEAMHFFDSVIKENIVKLAEMEKLSESKEELREPEKRRKV